MRESEELNISFAGCGFLMAYYCGVYSCFFERSRFLLDSGTKICGASSGALMGAIVACKMPPDKCCQNLLEMVHEARKGTLRAVCPSFNLLKTVRNFLIRDLPANAHQLATGRLYVSLTRVSDWTNVLVSEFDSKEDLIQALVCSCFYPLYCGMRPPRYRGIRYVDGALTDNMPHSNLSNTITVSPFSGESDISPHGTPFYFHEIHYNNVSIHINFINAYRVVIAFFPPEPEVLAEMCQNGYKDTFLFLKERVFCEACTKKHEEIRGSLSTWLTSLMRLVYLILMRICDWLPEMWSDLLTVWTVKRETLSLVWKNTFTRTFK